MTLPTLAVYLENPSTAGTANNYLVFDDATYGLFDTGTFAGPLGNQVDKVADLDAMNTSRGASNITDALFHPTTGTAQAVLDNRTRGYDPATNTDIRPGRSFQIIATWDGNDYTLFTGTVDDWKYTYPGRALNSVAVADCVDDTVRLVSTDINERVPQELSGARVRRLLDRANWPTDKRNIADGLTLMPAGARATSVWTMLLEASDSEMGEFYVTTENVATFRARTDPIEETRSAVSQATFGDSGSELRYQDVVVSYDSDRIRNEVTVTYTADGQVAVQSDAISKYRYGTKSYQVQASAPKSVAENIAQFLVDLYKEPTVRVDRIVLKPAEDPTNLWPEALGREIGDRITVKLTPPGGGPVINRDCWIRGIHHDYEGVDWTTTFDLQDLSNYRTYITFDTTQFDTDDDHYFFF